MTIFHLSFFIKFSFLKFASRDVPLRKSISALNDEKCQMETGMENISPSPTATPSLQCRASGTHQEILPVFAKAL